MSSARPRSPAGGLDETWLTGNLYVTVHGACDLPKKITSSLLKTQTSAHDPLTRIVNKIPLQKMDTYVRISSNGIKFGRTRTIRNDQDPQWEEQLLALCVGEVTSVDLHIKDDCSRSGLPAEDLGSVSLKPRDFLHGPQNRVWHQICGSQKTARLCISTEYVCSSTAFGSTIVPESPFARRTGCAVTLYADAHLDPERPLPAVPTARGSYEPRDCWNELYDSLCHAEKFIYITGWSVWAELRMLRRPGAESETLGELLKRKAAEGVRVLLLLWKDASSLDNPVMNKLLPVTQHGFMATREAETRHYFRHSAVVCESVKCGALGFKKFGKFATKPVGMVTRTEALTVYGMGFSHHQKTVVCDAPALAGPEGARRVIAYLGGLDLASGRYDDHHHELFATLATAHADDFYQPSVSGLQPDLGPRQPWHDVHCKLEGPVARDVLHNFEMRWKKQAKNREALCNVIADPRVLPAQDDRVPEGAGTWAVQMFRSIDHASALQVNGVEVGCAAGYVYAIRRAQRFIYIENQYLMGSCQYWASADADDIECPNHIPIELAMRIATKIRNGERFAVYIVIPLHPEGAAESATVQGILFWQSETFRMMYAKVAEALRQFGPADAHPTDYLNVFFLGARDAGPAPPPGRLGRRQELLLSTRRHMVYVHSKTAIFDDQYIILGSANLNQRSLDGSRDTEITVGASEDGAAEDAETGLCQGQVSGFRLALWAEHLGTFEPVFRAPQSLECVRRVRAMAHDNWQAFAGPAARALPWGHLAPYPYAVAKDGGLAAAVEHFPDHEHEKAAVMGTRLEVLQLMTT